MIPYPQWTIFILETKDLPWRSITIFTIKVKIENSSYTFLAPLKTFSGNYLSKKERLNGSWLSQYKCFLENNRAVEEMITSVRFSKKRGRYWVAEDLSEYYIIFLNVNLEWSIYFPE